ncbi:MAG: hypothetical protein IJ093_03445, partial [Bacilli bacterium]|nr:hypothetical protein [Bacilli bacterium]
ESLIFYTVKYISTNGDYENFVAKTAIAEKNVRETHVDAAQMVTITCKPDESVSPYQIYVACSAYKTTIEATTLSVREDASERWEKLSALYDASQIDPDLAKIYDYIYETEGLSAADKYLESIEDYVNSRSGEYEAKIVLDGLKKAENPLDYLQNNCAIFAQGTADGLVSYINGLQNILAENNILSPEEYKSLYILEALMPMEDKISYGLVEPLESGEYLSYNEENLTDKNVDFSIDYCNDYGVSKDGYLLGQTVGSITLPLALSIVIPTGGAYFGATASALSTYGNSKHSVLVSGGTLDQARFSGANDAAVSAAVWILGGKFSKACIDLAGKNIFAAMANGSTSADAIAIVSYCYDLDSLARKKYETGDYETYEQAYNAAFEDLGGIEGFKNKIIVATVTGGFYGMGHHKYAQNVQSNTTVEKTITNDSTGEEAVVAMTRPKALKAEKSVRSANPVKVSASTKLNTISSINSYAKSFVKEEVKKPKIVESEKGIDEYEKEGVNND